MTKREKIEQAVETLQGKWPDDSVEGEDVLHQFYTGRYVAGVCESTTVDMICTRKEFEQVAKELGWVNGCKWGVEYPTNGEKPELPDDVQVAIRNENGRWLSYGNEADQVKNWEWELIESFKIIDKRYKPESESNWHCRGEYPPVGSKAKLNIDEKMCEVEVIAYHGHGECMRAWVYNIGRGYRTTLPDSLRPIQSEQDKFTNNLAEHIKDVGDSVSFAVEGYEFAAKEVIKFFEENGWEKPYENQ
jgi:hypothetical protein